MIFSLFFGLSRKGVLTRLTNWILHQRDRTWGHDGHMVCVSRRIVIHSVDTPDYAPRMKVRWEANTP